jgi:hypothetical protein
MDQEGSRFRGNVVWGVGSKKIPAFAGMTGWGKRGHDMRARVYLHA